MCSQGPPAQSSSSPNVSLVISVDVPLSRAVIEERRRNKDLQIQAVCLAVSDSTVCQNRLHWPDRMEVSVRSQSARVMSRNHKLGANGRDAPTDLTPWLNRDATSVQVSVKALGPEHCFLFGVRAVVPQPTEVLRLARQQTAATRCSVHVPCGMLCKPAGCVDYPMSDTSMWKLCRWSSTCCHHRKP